MMTESIPSLWAIVGILNPKTQHKEIGSMVMLHSERGDGAVACYAGVCIYKGIWLLLGSWVEVTVFSVEGWVFGGSVLLCKVRFSHFFKAISATVNVVAIVHAKNPTIHKKGIIP